MSGRFEPPASVRQGAVERVLAGLAPYDAVAEPEQAAVRAAWDDRIATRVSSLDLADGLRQVGVPWAEADGDGRVLMRGTDCNRAGRRMQCRH